MTSWSVHATVDEPLEVLAAFAAHYLALGAGEVHLCLDAPCPETVAALSAIPGLRLTLCDTTYWQALAGRRPADQERRQILNARKSFSECRTDWFFYCDADELAVAPRPIANILAAVPPDITHVRIRVAERVFRAETAQRSIYDGAFRKGVPHGPDLIEKAYGPSAIFLSNGLSGHALGKSFVRRGADVALWMHFPRPHRFGGLRARIAPHAVQGPLLTEGWLLHFDGFTPFHWQLKLLRYARARAHAFTQEPLLFRLAAQGAAWPRKASRPAYRRQTMGRECQIDAVTKAEPGQLAAMMRAIRLDPAQRSALAAGNAMLEVGIDPAGLAQLILPDVALDFSAAHFDAGLRARHPDLVAALAAAQDSCHPQGGGLERYQP